MAFYPTNIVFTNSGSSTLMVADGLPNGITEISLHHVDYLPERKQLGPIDAILLKPLNGAEDFGYILNSNLVTPYAGGMDELWEVLTVFFNISTTGVVLTMTIAELQAAVAASELGPYIGGLIEVTDLADRGAFFLCHSATTVAEDGEGLFLNAVWVDGTQGDSSDIEALTGFAPIAFTGQWVTPSLPIQILVFVGPYTVVGPLWVVGVTVIEDQHGWTGTVVDYENGNLFATTITGTIPTVGDTIGTADMFATVISIAEYNGIVQTYIDPSAADLGYRMFQITDYTSVTTDPPTISPGYVELHRKTMRINYDTLTGGVFVVGSTVIDAGTGANGQVLQDDGAIIYIQPLDNYAWVVNNILYDGGDVSARMRVINDSLSLGYIEVSSPISFDVTNGWIFNRKQGTVDITTTKAQYDAGSRAILSLPWGGVITQFQSKGDLQVYNTLATEIKGWTLGVDSVVEAVINSGVTANYVTIGDGVSFTQKTITGSILGMVVPETDTNAETLPAASYDMRGNRVWTQLFNEVSILADSGTGWTVTRYNHQDFYTRVTLRLSMSNPLGVGYVGLGLVAKIGSVTVGTFPATLMTNGLSQTSVLDLDLSALGIPATTEVTLMTSNGVAYTSVDPDTELNVLTVTATYW